MVRSEAGGVESGNEMESGKEASISFCFLARALKKSWAGLAGSSLLTSCPPSPGGGSVP